MRIDPHWLTEAGLFFDLLGAVVMAYDLITLKEKSALNLGRSAYSSGRDEEDLKLPQVKDRLTQSRYAKIGVALLAFGFFLQLIGNLLS
jgi:hypothetical protein